MKGNSLQGKRLTGNALTVDVEDWYHVCGATFDVASIEKRVVRNVEKVLRLLEEHRTKATFFVLGSVAEEEPSLVPMIAAEGHEIASHGYSHKVVTDLSPQDFREEIRKTEHILACQGGHKPVGYRAPQWSLSLNIPWSFSILVEEGYRYDSSLNPLPFVGDAGGKIGPFTISTEAGTIVELPPMVFKSPFVNLPIAGGWGFRFFPFRLMLNAMERYETSGLPAVLYLHPRELDPLGPRLPLSPLKNFVAYGAKSDAAGRLEEVLRRFRFRTMIEVVDECQFA